MPERDDEKIEAGPGAILDELVEQQTGTHPAEVVPGQQHAAPGDEMEEEEKHAPSEHSIWPLVTAFGMLLIGVGILYHLAIVIVGTVVLMAALVRWMWEPWTS